MDVRKYVLTLTFTEPLLGAVPKNQDVYRRFIESKKPITQTEDELQTVEEIEARGWTGFHQNGDGLFLYDYAIKGFFKEAADTMREAFLPLKNVKSKLEQAVYVFPRRILLVDSNGMHYKEPSGVIERALKAMTLQGPRTTVMRSDYINEGSGLICDLHILKASKITEDHLRLCLDLGVYKGMGQFRSGSYGRFEYHLIDVP